MQKEKKMRTPGTKYHKNTPSGCGIPLNDNL